MTNSRSFRTVSMTALVSIMISASSILPAQAGKSYTPEGEEKYVGRCLLEVKNVPKIFRKCNVTEGNYDSLSLGMDEKNNDYFANVMADGDGGFDGYWNEERGATHAHSNLGKLKRNGQCFENATARVCAWR